MEPNQIAQSNQGHLEIVPIGPVDRMAISILAANLQAIMGLNTDIGGEQPQPEYAYLPGRSQYDADKIINILAAAEDDTRFKLGVTQYDLCTPILTYVFGESQLGGKVALISLYRLKDPDMDRAYLRSVKIGIHEVGHLMGIGHCREPDCLMRFSSNLEKLDRLPLKLCNACEYEVVRHVRALSKPKA